MEDLLYKSFITLWLATATYLWNEFVVLGLLNLLVGFHQKWNRRFLHIQPVVWLVKYKYTIWRVISAVFWLGFVLVAYGIWVNDE